MQRKTDLLFICQTVQTNIFVWHSTENCVLGYTLLRNLFVVLQAIICDNLYFDTIMSGVHTTDSLFFGVLGISLYLCIEIDKKEQV